MIRFEQYMVRPTPTRQIRASCSSQISSPTDDWRPGGRGIELYHEVAEADAQGISEVK